MAVDADPRIGTSLAGYWIEERLGQGGMGVVYRAHDDALDRSVAVKLITPGLAADRDFRDRFLVEARMAASLDHPNVVPVHDAGDIDGQLYLAMRYVEGTDLRELLAEQGRLEPERALAICSQVAQALDAAHKRGLVHRDVKPSNVLLDEDEHAYLADFGLTRRLTDAAPEYDAGLSIGTPAYVSPEQIEGKEVGPRSDQYSLACMFYQCLTGEPPYRRETEAATLYAHLEEEPPDYPGLEPVFAKALAKDPGDRYESCAAFIAAAREALPQTRRRKRLLLAGAAVLLLAAVAAVAAMLTLTGGNEATTTGTLVRIDPETNRVVSSTDVGETPNAVAASAAHVWVTDIAEQNVRQFDENGALVRRVDLGAPPLDVAAGRNLAHIPLGGTQPRPGLTTVSGSNGELGRDPNVADASAITASELDVWVATGAGLARLATGSFFAGLAGLVRETVSVPTTARVDPNEVPFTGIALSDRGTAWLIGETLAPKLWHVDLETSEVVAISDLPSVPHSVASTDDAAWVTALLDDVVWRIDPTSGAIVATIPVGLGAAGVDVDSEGVWVANSLEGTVSRIDPRTNEVVETIEVGGRPVDLALGGGAVWVVADSAPTGAVAPDERIAVGVIRECGGGIFGPFADISAAGAQLPLIRRGGVRPGTDVAGGVEGVSIDGKPVELLFACTDGTSEDPLNEARYLVEGEHVDVLVGPTRQTEGTVLRDYAKRQPGHTFVNGVSGAQSTTLRQPAANYFRFLGDQVQWYAGAGAYAYNELGWRDAVVVADDIVFHHELAAGFIAEFCSLGGNVERRLLSEVGRVPSSFLPEFPERADGAFVITSPALLALAGGHRAFAGNLADRIVGTEFSVNPTTLGELGERLRGVMVARLPSSPPDEQYAEDLARAFPEVAPLAVSVFDIGFYMAMEAVVQTLETVDGDLSDGQSRFRAALADVELDNVNGSYRLDERRNAIGPTFLSRVEKGPKGLQLGSLRVTEDVEQTFNGYFTPDSPEPSATEPKCEAGNPPPWAAAGG